jgi:hypothetical protein
VNFFERCHALKHARERVFLHELHSIRHWFACGFCHGSDADSDLETSRNRKLTGRCEILSRELGTLRAETYFDVSKALPKGLLMEGVPHEMYLQSVTFRFRHQPGMDSLANVMPGGQ